MPNNRWVVRATAPTPWSIGSTNRMPDTTEVSEPGSRGAPKDGLASRNRCWNPPSCIVLSSDPGPRVTSGVSGGEAAASGMSTAATRCGVTAASTFPCVVFPGGDVVVDRVGLVTDTREDRSGAEMKRSLIAAGSVTGSAAAPAGSSRWLDTNTSNAKWHAVTMASTAMRRAVARGRPALPRFASMVGSLFPVVEWTAARL